MLVRQLLNSQWNSFLNNSIFLATLDSTNNSRELYETLLYTGPPERLRRPHKMVRTQQLALRLGALGRARGGA